MMRALWIALCAALALSAAAIADPARDADAAARVNRLQAATVGALNAGDLTQAEALGREALTLSERVHGPDHPETGDCLSNLAAVLRAAERLEEAGPYYERAYAVHDAANGLQHPDTLRTLNNLAVYYNTIGRRDEAGPLLETVFLATQALMGFEHPDTQRAADNLDRFNAQRNRTPSATVLTLQDYEALAARLGPDHPDTVRGLANLAAHTETLGDYREAERLYERAMEAHRRVYGPDHPNTLIVDNNYGFLLQRMDRMADAEAVFSRVLATRERVLGPDHDDTVLSLNNLAGLYLQTSRPSQAAAMFQRVFAIRENRLGLGARDTLIAMNNLGGALLALGELEAAEELFGQALALSRVTLGETDPLTVAALNNLARIYDRTRRFRLAARHYALVLEAREATLGPSHPDTLETVTNLGVHHVRAELPAYAVGFFERAISGRRQTLGDTHIDTLSAMMGLALARRDLGEYPVALELAEQAAGGLRTRIETDAIDADDAVSEFDERLREGGAFRLHLDLAADAHTAGVAVDVDAVFLSAQAGRASAAAAALGASSARFAAPDDEAAALARRRQDLIADLRAAEQATLSAILNGDAAQTQVQRNASAALRAELAGVRSDLQNRFPDFADIAAPQLVAIADLQGEGGLLGDDEALVAFAPGAERLHAIVVTREEAVFAPLAVELDALSADIAALRAGLDLTGVADRSALPTYDLERAHRLHDALFAPLADVLSDIDHLTVIADGALESLPFHVLVAAPPAAGLTGDEAYRNAVWLSDRVAISHAPSVAALRAQRRNARASAGERPFVGFAAPALGTAEDSGLSPDLNDLLTMSGGFVTGGVCDLRPLPATAAMARAMAATLGADEDAVVLGAEATEARLTAMNGSGELRQARVVAFATHGLVAGELPGFGLGEPALALTPAWRCGEAPPAGLAATEDGLLTASEISALSLDADWVLLPACNTAASDGSLAAQPLSGLARAFFYAGARSLLVSHWAADEEATRRLIEALFDASAESPSQAGRLSAAMAAVRAQEGFGHPALWGAFVIVSGGSDLA